MFISLSQRKGTKETRPSRPPFQGRLNLLRAETALHKGLCVTNRACAPSGLVMVVYRADTLFRQINVQTILFYRMVDACKTQGVSEPEYEVNGGFVKIVFRRTTNGDDSVNDSLSDSVNDSLSDSVNETYLTIKANPGIQRKRISELTGKSIPTVDRHIALLAKASLIEHRDSDKTGGYYPAAKK